MNKKLNAVLKLKDNKYELHCEDGQIIERKYLGWISQHIDNIYEHLPRVINPITEDDLQIIIEQQGKCFLELQEKRKMATTWEKAIDSYSMEGDPWYHEIRLIDQKMVLHFT